MSVARCTTATDAESELFPGTGSGVTEETVAVFTRLVAVTAASTTTGSVIVHAVSPTSRPSGFSHVTRCRPLSSATTHPAGAEPTSVMPAGSRSLTVTGPAASEGPRLTTSRVYVAPVAAPATISATSTDFVMARSAIALDPVVTCEESWSARQVDPTTAVLVTSPTTPESMSTRMSKLESAPAASSPVRSKRTSSP